MRTAAAIVILLVAAAAIMANDRITVKRTVDLAIGSLDHPSWSSADVIAVTNYWSGAEAPRDRHLTARVMWSDTALYIRFEATQNEPLVIADKPDLTKKVVGLWERDVCEIFIAPDRTKRRRYFEFEVAPTGEWIDLGIEITEKGRVTDWEYRSGMTTSARIEKNKVVMAMKIPFTAFGRVPKAGDVWLGNLFRCVGSDPGRVYLAWRPTKTEKPNFHVPETFGEFVFVK